MTANEVWADLKALRRMEPETLETDEKISGACRTAMDALTVLQSRADGIPVPGPFAIREAEVFYENARVGAALFSLAAQRFEDSQNDGPLPWVFAWFPRDFVGPSSRAVSNKGKNQKWMEEQFKRLEQTPRSREAELFAGELRQALGVDEAPRVQLSSREIRMSLNGGLGVGVEITAVWVIQEFSEGSTDVTLRYENSASTDAALGVRAQIDTGDDSFAAGARVATELAASTSTSWTRSFRSKAAAEVFVDDHVRDSVVERGLTTLPWLGGWVARRVDATDMNSAPVQEEMKRGEGSSSASLGVGGQRDTIGVDGSVTGSLSFGERADERTGLEIDVAMMHGTAAATVAALGNQRTEAVDGSQRVELARNAAGRPVSLTVTTRWDDKPGQLPPGVQAAPERRPKAEESDNPHQYERTVTVDLTDPAHADLARSVHNVSKDDLLSVADEVERVGELTSFLEEGTVDVTAVGGQLEGAFIAKVSAGGGVVVTDRQTLNAWIGTGGRLTQIVGG